MFLSMVAAPSEDHRIGVLSGQKADCRFNVATSRAKEQMWLFYTATLNDLSSNCLRYKLLKYCLHPKPPPTDFDMDLDELRLKALRCDRSIEKPPKPFESWFEVDVFFKIIDRGYRVLPQFEVAGYSIDLVVDGIRGRLAVECDGDYWHGIGQYEKDMGRQRILERCGWTFWRVRDSVFTRDPDKALEDLWDTLKREGILSEFESPKEEPTAGQSTEEQQPEEESRPTKPGIKRPRSQPTQVGRQPYRRWETRLLRDPRTAKLKEVTSGLVDIISVEGPMLCYRAFQIYTRAAGFQKIGKKMESIFKKAVQAAIRQELIEEKDENRKRDLGERIVRKVDTPDVIVRTRGNRCFEEIPPSEVGKVMSLLLDQNPVGRHTLP